MKKLLAFIIFSIILISCLSPSVFASDGEEAPLVSDVWDGSSDKSWFDINEPKTEYTLTTAEQLAGLAELVNTGTYTFYDSTVKLGADMIFNEGIFSASPEGRPLYNGEPVNANVRTWTVIGERWAANNNFTVAGRKLFFGNFDGQGHVVSGLYVNDSVRLAGFFSCFAGGAIENLSIINSYFCGDSRNGSFAGFINNDRTKQVSLKNLYSDAYVVSNNSSRVSKIGGIVGAAGYFQGITIDTCWFNGALFAIETSQSAVPTAIGGIVGSFTDYGTGHIYENIENTLMTGAIFSPGKTPHQVGGLVGHCVDSKFSLKNCIVAVTDSDISPNESVSISNFISFFEGTNTVTSENCYYLPTRSFYSSRARVPEAERMGNKINGVSAWQEYLRVGYTYYSIEIAKAVNSTEDMELTTDVFDIKELYVIIKDMRTSLDPDEITVPALPDVIPNFSSDSIIPPEPEPENTGNGETLPDGGEQPFPENTTTPDITPPPPVETLPPSTREPQSSNKPNFPKDDPDDDDEDKEDDDDDDYYIDDAITIDCVGCGSFSSIASLFALIATSAAIVIVKKKH